MNWYKNEKLLTFIGGATAAVVGTKILKAKKTRELCVKGLAWGITAKNNAEAAVQSIKEDAEDICHDAREQAAMAEDAKTEDADK